LQHISRGESKGTGNVIRYVLEPFRRNRARLIQKISEVVALQFHEDSEKLIWKRAKTCGFGKKFGLSIYRSLC
jgi:hypothetical protein